VSERNDYIRRHVLEVQKAVARGIPVFGYLCWSITSNREWGLAFSPGNDFGLYHIDLDGEPGAVADEDQLGRPVPADHRPARCR